MLPRHDDTGTCRNGSPSASLSGRGTFSGTPLAPPASVTPAAEPLPRAHFLRRRQPAKRRRAFGDG